MEASVMRTAQILQKKRNRERIEDDRAYQLGNAFYASLDAKERPPRQTRVQAQRPKSGNRDETRIRSSLQRFEEAILLKEKLREEHLSSIR